VLSAPWWKRAALTGAGKLPSARAVYCIFDRAQSELSPSTLARHRAIFPRDLAFGSALPMRSPWIAYRAFPGAPRRVLHELESDILGWHFTIVLMLDEPFTSGLCIGHRFERRGDARRARPHQSAPAGIGAPGRDQCQS
jgi:hypothetical protein